MTRISDLAAFAGIQPTFTDIWGEEQKVSPKTVEAILKALGLTAKADLPNRPPVIVVRAGHQDVIDWDGEAELILENGESAAELKAENGRLSVGPLPPGYHRLKHDEGETVILSAPPRCWMPERIAQGERFWGLAAQLYGVRSERPWGIGDFTDLIEIATRAAATGAAVIGLNPLHALFPNQPDSFSPYAPSNRLFLNYLYIDPAKIDGYEDSMAPAESLASGDLLDYPVIAAAKRPVLESLYTRFVEKADRGTFDAFRVELGEPLARQAVFDALSEHFADAGWWGEWPEDYRNPAGDAVGRFAAEHARRVEFFAWLQWQADKQLAAAQATAKDGGMLLGLYRDLAVGSGLSGAEVWQEPESYVRGVSVGAPPDEYNRGGQNWGLPPFNPVALRATGYRAFVALLRANMRHAGAIRIDHAFALSRLFWVPEGTGAKEGAYVTYPFDEMLAVLKIESHRQCCMVIGEDLGTFPPGYAEKAALAGVFSYRVLFFERSADAFNPPSSYPGLSLATITTHDLPTLAGWYEGADIDAKAKLELYPDSDLEKADRAGRKSDGPRLNAAFAAEGIEDEPTIAAPLFLARSPAALVMMQLEDLLGVKPQANLPATTTEHPNWRRRLPAGIDAVFADEGTLATLVPKLVEARRRLAPSRPRSTYRLQFHKDFTFDDAAKIAPYLADLGISHVYCSPYTTARPGSTHGYDVFDQNRFNPELGGAKGYAAFVKALKESGLRQILDFVPNHMGVGTGNSWWMDMLRHGAEGPHGRAFDVDWARRDGRILLPNLGKPLAEALKDGEIGFEHRKDDGWVATYFDNFYPLDPNGPLPSKTKPDSAETRKILDAQHWELAFWKDAPTEINYRRFFEINDLAGLRIEDEAVFDDAHRLAFDLVAKGELSGLRIDHIDGLADPKQYLERLQEKAGPNLFVSVEKILEPGEHLRNGWAVTGTSGYEVLNQINNVFVDSRNAEAFDRFYRAFTGNERDLPATLAEAKRFMLEKSFESECGKLLTLAGEALDRDPESLREAISALLVAFPVYRTYISGLADEDDLTTLDDAIAAADPAFQDDYALLRKLFAEPERAPEFVTRFQQLSGPLMAKGLEDTSFYRYYRFLSLNEVGGEPSHFGVPVETFHEQNCERLAHYPANLIATSTHDTKRGEDCRARLNVLSEIPDEWIRNVGEWSKLLRAEGTVFSTNSEYLLYQSLIGSWPLELLDAPKRNALEAFEARVWGFLEKALREGKEETNWTSPDETYETAAKDFLAKALRSQPFLNAFLPFARKVAACGAVNSYAQTLLKYTIPGIPDCYQGCEGFDFSMVDPDNRRPIDYAAREKSLAAKAKPADLFARWQNGALKQRLIATLLAHRNAHPALFDDGEYQPLAVKGAKAERIVAFLRRLNDETLLVVVPRFVADADGSPVGHYWADTRVQLPENLPPLKNLMTGRVHSGNEAQLSELCDTLPFAVLATES